MQVAAAAKVVAGTFVKRGGGGGIKKRSLQLTKLLLLPISVASLVSPSKEMFSMRSKLEDSPAFEEGSFTCSLFLKVLDGQQQPARVKAVKNFKQAKGT